MLIDHRADSGIHVDSGVYVPQYDSALLRAVYDQVLSAGRTQSS